MEKRITFDIISEFSRANGFFLAGITDLSSSRTNPQFINWIKAGYHGTMTYLQNNPGYEIRLNPQNILPVARSIIFLAARYPKSEYPVENNPLNGVISSYAWGEDYHVVLRKRTQTLIEGISRYLGKPIQSRVTIDSAPVLEKPLAQRAGLGWQGRNTCLISPVIGSFFFISGIFLDVELEPTPGFDKDYCGKCRKCVDACPTDCILPDRTMDARRCISYLTIENRGGIPMELRPLIGNRIFGCDICQNVCPWNHKVGNTDVLDEFMPKNTIIHSPDLKFILALTAEEFSQFFRHSPIKRARRAGLIRNAVVALGNTQFPEVIPILQFVLENETEPVIRSHSAWALGRINTSRGRDILSKSLHRETDDSVLQEIKQALEA